MPRTSRMAIPDEKTVYHIMSRTALAGFPFGDLEKDQFVKILKQFSRLYFVEVLGFCIMDNHFHALIRVWPERYFTDEEIRERFESFYGGREPGVCHRPDRPLPGQVVQPLPFCQRGETDLLIF